MNITEIILVPPDFRKKVYDDPKGMHEEVLRSEKEINEAISRIKIARINSCLRITHLEIGALNSTWVLGDFSNSLLSLNETIRQLRRAERSLKDFWREVWELNEDQFNDTFLLRPDRARRNGVWHPRLDYVTSYQDKETLLKYNRMESEELKPTVPYDPEICPVMTNFLRYHKLEDQITTVVVKDAGESSLNVYVETKDGKWFTATQYSYRG